MRNITRRQLLGATALGITGTALWGLSGSQSQKLALQLRGLAAVDQLNAATQQLFNSVNVVAPKNLVKM